MARALDAFAGPAMNEAAVAQVMRELFPPERGTAPAEQAQLPVAPSPSVTVSSPLRRAVPIALAIAVVMVVVVLAALALR
jgi:hypothetical protein